MTFRVKIGEVHGRVLHACGDDDSIWVEMRSGRGASLDFSPARARELAHFLQAAANAAENIS